MTSHSYKFLYAAQCKATLLALLFSFALAPATSAQICPFDDGNSTLAREGLMLTRYALGMTGPALVANTDIAAADAPTVEATILCPSCGLDINGNGAFDTVDATIISRKIAGFSGAALTNGLALGAGSRNTPAAVQSFLLAGCGATGGTVTSVIAGLGLTGGTISTSGTISADTTYLQRRVSASCAVGSSIRAIAADGTVTCQVDAIGGNGTVTSVATGAGLTGGPITTSGSLGLAATQLLPTTACASNQIAKWNGSAWTCATDATGGSGTVTSIATGAGLTGGPVNTTGTVSIDPTYRLPQLCANNQLARFNTTTNLWECFTQTTSSAVTSVATGAGLTGGPITTTGTINLAATQLLPTTACANNQIPKWNGAAWICAAETAAGSGTVTGILTGIGLTGGPITTVGTVNIQASYRLPQSCATDQIIRWNGTAWVCSTMPVLPAACSVGQLLTLTSGGEIQCTGGPTAVVRVDSIGSVGQVPRVAIGTDGFPVMSYYDRTNATIKLAKCGNASCNGPNSIVTLASTGSSLIFQVYSAIAVPADGRPVVTYHDTTNTALMFIRCADAACSGVNTPVTIDNSGYSSGSTSAIAISSADGFPVISYNAQAVDAFSPGLLRVYKCNNADCTAGVMTDVDAPVGVSVGLQSSIAVPGDGLPVISYFDASDKNLRVAKCSTTSCAGSATVTLFDVAEDSGGATAIAIGADGLPVVAYTGGTNLAPTIKVLKCAVAACTSGTVTLVDGTANVASPSMRAPADGLPVMSYWDLTNSRLKVVKCGNATCSSSNTFTVIDGGPNVGSYHSLAVSPDGIPVIAYFEAVVDDLKVYKCANAFCRAP